MRKLLLLILGIIPLLSFGQSSILNDKNVFQGDTKYQYSGETARICWTPPVEDWSGVFVFEIQVIHFQRNEIVFQEGNITDINKDFIIPRTGHYEVKIRTCHANNLEVCSEWASAARGAGSSGACEPSGPTSLNRNWWLFAWIAAPTIPSQEN